MKRVGKLNAQVCSMDNLILADKNARTGKTQSYGVIKFDLHREENLAQLQKDLMHHEFRTSRYHIFMIHDPKEREIYQLPYYPDRIVHHAVMNVVKPIWTSYFTSDTFSCIEGRGINQCRAKVRKTLSTDWGHAKYALKGDIKKYYPSIDNEVLKRIVRKKIKDPELLWLLDNVIDSAKGIPIGNYLSQYFANLYLTPFDHWLKEVKKVKHYYRYADDIVILSDSKEELHALRRDIEEYLAKELHLILKRNWQVFPIAESHADKTGRGLDFVGFVFYRKETRIRKGIKKNFCRACAKLEGKDISEKDYKRVVASWLGWAKYSDSDRLVKKILKPSIYEKIKIRHSSRCP